MYLLANCAGIMISLFLFLVGFLSNALSVGANIAPPLAMNAALIL